MTPLCEIPAMQREDFFNFVIDRHILEGDVPQSEAEDWRCCGIAVGEA